MGGRDMAAAEFGAAIGKARPAEHSAAGLVRSWLGLVWQGTARQGKAGKAWPGVAMLCSVGRRVAVSSPAGRGKAGTARLGMAGSGLAGLGKARPAVRIIARRCEVRLVPAGSGQGKAGKAGHDSARPDSAG
jgi:hypothetical protein